MTTNKSFGLIDAAMAAMELKIEALQDECERLRQDAERYRWLKKSAFCGVWARGDGIALVVPRAARVDIDSKIDAAMRKEDKQ